VKKNTILLTMTALMAVPAGAIAGNSVLRFTNHFYKKIETTLPDGRKAVALQYYSTNTSDKADDPMNNTAGDCVGQLILSKEGKTLAGSGNCVAQNVSGDGMTLWWKVDEAGTAKCPDLCGSFGTVDAYGKLKGMTSSGTWVTTHVFAEGSLGILKSTYTMK
jgi:hypothetical protein